MILPKEIKLKGFDEIRLESIGYINKDLGKEYLGDVITPFGSMTAVFYDPNPNRSLGHSEFYGIFSSNGIAYICKLHPEDLNEWQWMYGKECNSCGDHIVSTFRHDYTECSCKETMVDGGRDYNRCSKAGSHRWYNTLTGEIITRPKRPYSLGI